MNNLLIEIKMKLLFPFLLFVPFCLFAQKDTTQQKQFSLEIGANLITLPIGLFASTNNNGGFAKKDFNSVTLSNPFVFIELRYSPRKPIVTNILGLKATTIFATKISGFRIPFDEQSFDKNLMNAVPGMTIQSFADDYTSLNFMIGFYNYYNLSTKQKKFYFYDRYFLGLSNVSLPNVSTSANGQFVSSRGSGNTTSFCYQFGLGIKKGLDNKFSAGLGIDFFSTSPVFKNIETKTNNGITTYKDVRVPISILTMLSVSFGFRF